MTTYIFFIVLSRGTEFRKEFMNLAALRSFFPSVPFLALTATAPVTTIDLLRKSLCMNNYKLISASPNRKNIFLSKQLRSDTCHGLKSYDDILLPIAYKLKEMRETYPQTIIYTKLKYCGYGYKLLERILGDNQYVNKTKNPADRLFTQFHSPQTCNMKADILSEMLKESANIRVILATSALGMGVNLPYITQVIHIGPPSSLEAYIQEIGRAGRSGVAAEAKLYFCKSDISEHKVKQGLIQESMRNFCLNESECIRTSMLTHFGFKDSDKQINCCNICCKIDVFKPRDDSNEIKKSRCLPEGNLEKITTEFDIFLAEKDIESAEPDAGEMFFNDIICYGTIIPSLLTDIEYIGNEIDLLLKYGVCNENDSSVIFNLIEKYTTRL